MVCESVWVDGVSVFEVDKLECDCLAEWESNDRIEISDSQVWNLFLCQDNKMLHISSSTSPFSFGNYAMFSEKMTFKAISYS